MNFFLFPKRKTLSEADLATRNRQEFDDAAEAIRLAYSQAQTEPQATLDAVKSLLGRVRRCRTLDPHQREILNAYIYDAAGHARLELRQFETGLSLLEKAARLYRQLPDKSPLVNNLLNQARGWMLRNKLEPATAKMEEALSEAKAGRLPQVETDVLYKLGMLYSLTGQAEKAGEVFGQGLLLTRQLGNQVATATFLSQVGQLALQKNELDKAGDYFERSRQIFEEAADLDNLMYSYGQLNQLYRRQQDYGRALEAAGRGLELARQLKNTREENVFLQDLTLIHLARKDLAEAQPNARASLALAEQHNDRESRLRTFELLAQIALQQQDYPGALAWAEQGYQQAQRANSRREMALFLNDLADIKLAQGQHLAALADLEKLAGLFQQPEDLPTLATLYVRMGDIYLESLHNPQEAGRLVERIFQLIFYRKNQHNLSAFTSTMRLIQLMATRSYYAESLLAAEKCLELAHTELNGSLKGSNKRRPEQDRQNRWLLFTQILIVLVATLQDLKSGTLQYEAKVKEVLTQLVNRFGDTFTLDKWTSEMYERLK